MPRNKESKNNRGRQGSGKSKRGAAMDEEKQKEIPRKGGKASH